MGRVRSIRRGFRGFRKWRGVRRVAQMTRDQVRGAARYALLALALATTVGKLSRRGRGEAGLRALADNRAGARAVRLELESRRDWEERAEALAGGIRRRSALLFLASWRGEAVRRASVKARLALRSARGRAGGALLAWFHAAREGRRVRAGMQVGQPLNPAP